MDSAKTWLVTGASKGLGLSLVKQLLAAGHRVAATSRDTSALSEAVGGRHDDLLTHDRFLPLKVELEKEGTVIEAVQQTIGRFGRIDVVVNNAGYGIGGSIEELTDRETRDNFDVNVFGTLNVIRAVSPFLRAQGSGHIINISSIAGIAAATGWAIYAATKSAVIALSEVLAEDLKSFGVKVTVVAPGAFRTSFLTPESLTLTAHPIEAYREVRASHERYLKMDGAQAGDPEKAAEAMIHIAGLAEPPLYLLLGSDAYQRAFNKLRLLDEAFGKTEALTKSTDF